MTYLILKERESVQPSTLIHEICNHVLGLVEPVVWSSCYSDVTTVRFLRGERCTFTCDHFTHQLSQNFVVKSCETGNPFGLDGQKCSGTVSLN